MKRLMILSIVALASVSSLGCRTCSSWWNRGASCETCVSDVSVSGYPSGTLVSPPTTEILPGPAEVIVPRG